MANFVQPQQVLIYVDERGYEPFTTWLNGLRDKIARKRILARMKRVEQGNLGDYKSVGDGVLELRLFFGSGYRIYFGQDGDTLIILLLGGDKSSQTQDIELAKVYWEDYLHHA